MLCKTGASPPLMSDDQRPKKIAMAGSLIPEPSTTVSSKGCQKIGKLELTTWKPKSLFTLKWLVLALTFLQTPFKTGMIHVGITCRSPKESI
ncbi:hypothetical protein L484_009954 [Morus notabilis]|uniref:Uncharacterized protein n=1 Tax=Morus notabilis TaxID=981085 RepID=W9RKP9_9ROSA|nr:hypothetical protein L484_009954 [Morus notabilis]